MNIELLAIGKTRSRFVAEGMDEYLSRLRHYLPYSVVELPDIKNAGRLSRDEQKEAEGRAILSRITPSDYLILLDERGIQYTSLEFAKKMESLMASGKKKVVLAIGGPYGFSKAVYDRSSELLSLSKMTFNHEMVRLFITEQCYRAMTIIRGEPYHHE